MKSFFQRMIIGTELGTTLIYIWSVTLLAYMRKMKYRRKINPRSSLYLFPP